jgi:hypothetical protein
MTEAVRKLDELLECFATEIEAFLNGGPNRKLKHLEEAEEAGLDPDAIANLADSWGKAEGLRVQREIEAAPKPKAKVLGLRPLSVPRRIEAPANDEGVGPQIEAAPLVNGKGDLAKETARPKVVRLRELVGRIKLKPRPQEQQEEEPEPRAEPVVEPDVVGIERALVPVKRFASRIILPDVGQVAQIKEIVGLVNLKHQIVGNYGGRCMVVSWERWPVNSKFLVPTFQKVNDFKNRYANRFVEQETKSGTQRAPVGAFWFSHPASATFDGVGFRPGESEVLPGKLLNLWRGWAVEPKKGRWRLLRRHIYLVLGNGDWKAGRYILRWFAHMFQHPGEPGQTVLVFKGEEEGLGKGIMAQAIMQILGPYSLPVSDPKHFLGAFSGHLQHCVFLFLDEAFWAGDQKAEGRLKSLVTERYITIEPKYVTPFQTPNLLHIMMASNNDWVVPAGPTARRYAVFEVSNKHRRDKAYFNALRAEIEGGGAAAMLYDLLAMDLGDWEPQELYETDALVEQKQWSLRGLDAWIEGMLRKGMLPVPCSLKYPNRCLSKHLLEDALKHDRYTNDSNVATKLKKVFGKDNMKDFNNQLARGWAFPPLTDCRGSWEQRYGGKWNWHHDIKDLRA